MLGSMEKFLFESFPKMPKPVRIFTYLFVLFLFAYLLLAPKFVNGQLVVRRGESGTMAYRGGELRQHVDGRVFNYKVNEQGYWSVPVVSLLPHAVEVEVYNVDADAWFPVRFDWRSVWTKDSYKLEIAANPDRVQVMQSRSRARSLLAHVAALIGAGEREAHAAMLVPRSGSGRGQAVPEGMSVKKGIIEIVSSVMKLPQANVTGSYQLTGGANSPSHVQRIEIVSKTEKKFGVTIPDEHWTYIRTVGELADYVAKKKSGPGQGAKETGESYKFVR